MYQGTALNPGLYYYMVLKSVLGENFFRQLAKKEIVWTVGYTATLNLVKIEEVPIGVCIGIAKVENAKRLGAPVDWARLSPLPNGPNAWGISANAPHPNAAKLWLDFILADPAQIALAGTPPDYRYLPAKPGIPPTSEMLSGLDIPIPDWTVDVDPWIEEYKEMFGLD